MLARMQDWKDARMRSGFLTKNYKLKTDNYFIKSCLKLNTNYQRLTTKLVSGREYRVLSENSITYTV